MADRIRRVYRRASFPARLAVAAVWGVAWGLWLAWFTDDEEERAR